jgi:alpha/beta superfamily hydrolase
MHISSASTHGRSIAFRTQELSFRGEAALDSSESARETPAGTSGVDTSSRASFRRQDALGHATGPSSIGREPVEASSRVDPVTGVREEIHLAGYGESRMFMSTYRPPRPTTLGVVICPAFQSEFTRNYRREVLLARSLAGRGFAVCRFHYWGSGNSQGEIEDMTLDTMVQDAVTAGESLMEKADVERLAFVGTRWGSLIAAQASRGFNGSPIALWEPVADTSRYFRDLFRMRLIGDLKEGSNQFRTTGAVIKHLKAAGSLDVMGLTVTKQFHDSATNVSLHEAIGEEPRPLLLIQIDTRENLKDEYNALVERWRGQGFRVDVDLVVHSEAWWFGGGNVEARGAAGEAKSRMTEALVDRTATWVGEVLK